MLGIDDPYVMLAYLLSVGGALLCAVYGLANWNRGDDAVKEDDRVWAVHEKQMEEELDA